MEFGGVLGLDGLVGASNGHQSGGGGGGSCLFTSVDNSSINSEANIGKRGIFGGFVKHVRCAEADQEQQGEYWRSLKLAKCSTGEATMQGTTKSSSSSSAAVPFLMRSNSHSGGMFSDGGEQMLSFSSSNDGSLSSSYHYHPSPYSSASASAPSFYRNAGLASGSTNVSLHGLRGAFSPSQWMELEHQALIYKYIIANIPIPSSLLIPIRRNINTSGMTTPFLSGSLRSTTLGWGPFHLGFSGNADPEPGRCRRTDGKKWRCSRDAVADQKYCERHMNRGRHRSRKHVEGQTGHASKAMPIILPSQQASAVSGGGGGGSSNNALGITSQQSKGLQSNVMEPSPAQTNRIEVSKEKANDHVRDSDSISIPANASPNLINSFPISKHHNPFEETPSRFDFGLISSESLLDPLRTSYSSDIDFDSISELNSRRPQPNSHPFLAWPRLGGPLGEVLNKTNSNPKDLSRNRSSSSLNLLTNGWDTSPRLQSSPTGVLQKITFASLSSSTGSSPRAESRKIHDSASQSGDFLGSTLVNLSTVPSL